MARRFVDISVALEANIPSDPPFMLPRIDYSAHAETASQVAAFFPGLDASDLPGGEGWAVEALAVSTHNGTHLDAPYHHHSTMDGGKPAITIDEVPLEWCFNPGVKLDFRDRPDGHVVDAAEVEAELERIGHELRPLDIVVVNTRAGSRYGHDDYLSAGCGMGREATLYLLERRARRARDRHRRLVVGRAVLAHREALGGDARPVHRLGGAPRVDGHRLLPHGEALEPRIPARHGVRDRVLPGQDQARLGGLHARGRAAGGLNP